MSERSPTVRTLALGKAMQAAMKAKGWTATVLAERLGWSVSKVSRLTTGVRRANPKDLSGALAVLGVVGRERDELFEFADHIDQISWWQEHGQQLPTRQLVLRRIESAATSITSYTDQLVPPLLQIPDYIRTLLQGWPLENLEEHVRHRTQAQSDLLSADPTLTFFIDEYALVRDDIPPGIMSDQIHHLLRVAVIPTVTLRVVPQSVGIRPYSSFALMMFDDHPPLVYLENYSTSAFLEEEGTFAAFCDVIASLRQNALDRSSTLEWLRTLAAALSAKAEHEQPT